MAMASTYSPHPRLLLFDVTTGPRPKFYLPRLCEIYDLHIMWIPSGDAVKDLARAAQFEEWCGHTTMHGQETATEELTAFARNWRPEGILGFGEMTMMPVHAAASHLGLPANAPWSIEALRNKHEQRRLLAKANIPTPRYASVRSLAEFRHATAHVGTSAILKPVAGAGSMATYRLDEATDLAELWAEACANYATDPRGSAAQDFILEEFMISSSPYPDPRYGAYASVESVVQRGEIQHLAVTDKLPLSPNFRENGGILPSVLAEEHIVALLDCASTAIEAIGIVNSGVHTEIMFTAGGPRVIEVNSRIGGGVTEMLHYSCGYDSVLARAAIATGRPLPEFTPPVLSTGYYTMQAPAFDAVLSDGPTVDELLAIPEIVDAEVPYAIGERPAWHQGTPGGTVARVVATADSPGPLLDLYDVLKPGGLFRYTPAERPAP
ncbi:ATP-grasp domain-containing protein [Streptomyces sp. So13.3]|uniref:ATP-grasp domain-containing protein n=1 Tax=unclassified Streptomyces TaxID=2593676 RepID=UPI00164DCB85|nr:MULTISPECIES: ATP-grasp domain-containing protein [unclassified Streptomyces]MCZ4099175.1 ATP-grasp domain-containing protein [Streptomyces sp. H39-C1]QNA72241.1 ATP-grasp domain-containing protein [Streptomyces sp. So13.3]